MTDGPAYGDVFPSLTYDDASTAIDWLCRAFGFQKRLVVPGENGQVVHSELSHGAAVVMVSSPKAEWNRVSPRNLSGMNQALSLYVDDPEGHLWYFGTYRPGAYWE